jgi:hypothetical protein
MKGIRATDAHIDGIVAPGVTEGGPGLVVDGLLGRRREARPVLLEL